MTGEERKALCLIAQKHCAEVSVTETDLSVVGNRAGNAEGLKSETDFLCSLGGALYAVLKSDGASDNISPCGILKADRLNALYYAVSVNSGLVADFLRLFDRGNTVLLKLGVDLIYSSFITFK